MEMNIFQHRDGHIQYTQDQPKLCMLDGMCMELASRI